MDWVCYLLVCDGRTYIGATKNKDRRLRQHNGEIVGGAKATRGRTWTRVCYVKGFPDSRAALQFEWRWKRMREKGTTSVQRSMAGLDKLIRLGKSTKNSVPFAHYNLVVVKDVC